MFIKETGAPETMFHLASDIKIVSIAKCIIIYEDAVAAANIARIQEASVSNGRKFFTNKPEILNFVFIKM